VFENSEATTARFVGPRKIIATHNAWWGHENRRELKTRPRILWDPVVGRLSLRSLRHSTATPPGGTQNTQAMKTSRWPDSAPLRRPNGALRACLESAKSFFFYLGHAIFLEMLQTLSWQITWAGLGSFGVLGWQAVGGRLGGWEVGWLGRVEPRILDFPDASSSVSTQDTHRVRSLNSELMDWSYFGTLSYHFPCLSLARRK